MTLSRRSPAFLAIARPYVRSLLARDLDGVEIAGLSRLIAASAAGPVVCAINHVSFWDPLVLIAIEERLAGVGHALMDAANLARLPFFAQVGAVPLDRSDHTSAMRDLDAAAALVTGAAERMWIFPQGRQRPPHLRPLELRPGVLRLLERSGAALVPVAISYAFLESPRPRGFVAIGHPRTGVQTLPEIEEAIVAELARIDRHHVAKDPEIEPLVASRARTPVESRWTALLAGWMAGRP